MSYEKEKRDNIPRLFEIVYRYLQQHLLYRESARAKRLEKHDKSGGLGMNKKTRVGFGAARGLLNNLLCGGATF